jgi:hypothetical protein
MLRIPTKIGDLEEWSKDTVDECMATSQERGMIYTRALQYYYQGSYDNRAAIYNKVKQFIDKLGGFLMQPTDVRFNVVFDSSEDESMLERAQLVGEKLTADFRITDSDIVFAEAVTHSLINGTYLLKVRPDTPSFKVQPVHPQNFGVLSETTLSLEEQEAFCHVSYPTVSRLRAMLDESHHPDANNIMQRVMETRRTDKDEELPTYFHQMVVGGLQPLGNPADSGSTAGSSQAAGIVNVFPIPTPWRPQRKISQTVRFCEVWIKDADRDGDYTTLQLVYPDIVIEGRHTRRNLSRVPGRQPFVKVTAQQTPGYFWGRSTIADVQMLQDLLNKRLRDIKVMWDRNVNAPQVFSGFTGLTEESYFKIINEGGFLSDPNPNAKAQKLVEPPPQTYMEELEFIWKMFDEAGGFSPVMSGQGEPGVRAGVHAQTLVRTSSPRLIDQAARVERQLATCGELGLRIMQAEDGLVYITDNNTEFMLSQLAENFQVIVDSHSASPAFAEDNRQVAISLARAGAIDAEDLIHMLHPPGAELLLARLRQRKKEEAAKAAQQEQKEMLRDVLQLPGTQRSGGKAGRRPKGG